jgi:S-adenosylmethionine hydrolase
MVPIALLTDFGTSDWFVASMKGSIVSINPQARIIDITHEIPPGDIHSAAFILKACYRSFPPGTIFVAVVDPGVGSPRKAVVARAGAYSFVGPDNGIFSYILQNHTDTRVFSLDKRQYFKAAVSATFHGRDIFAPIGAHLSNGTPPEAMGSVVNDFRLIPWPEPKVLEKTILGEIVFIDLYGNAISNIDRNTTLKLPSPISGAMLKSTCFAPLSTHYQQAAGENPIALFNSLDLIEIAINGGSAAKAFGVAIGDPVELR